MNSGNNNKIRTNIRTKAFAIADIIVGLMILAGVSGVIVYNLQPLNLENDYEQITFTDQLIRDLQITQTLALNNTTPYKLRFNTSDYNITDINESPYISKLTNTNIISYPNLVTVSVSPANYNPIYFFESGEPGFFNTSSSMVEPISSNITITVTNNRISKNITIYQQTGLIE